MIPGLADAEFARFGVMHRNIYVNAPAVLNRQLRFKGGPENLFLAGQITGVEGYLESTAMGVAAALNMAALLLDKPFPEWPRETAIGSLLHYLSDAMERRFQPMNINLGLFPPLEERIRNKARRSGMIAQRAEETMSSFLTSLVDLTVL